MFRSPSVAGRSVVVVSQGLVDEDQNTTTMVSTNMTFSFQTSSSSLPHQPRFLPPHSFHQKNEDPTPRNLLTRVSFPSTMPSNHQDGGPPSQRSPTHPWSYDDENKRSPFVVDSKNGSSSTSNALSVGVVRMKKAKATSRKVRDPRFCFKTMSDVDVLDDGYKWRKYGQKVVKNTKHPRSYYKCTRDNCRVKKRVERLAEDPRMVITTYEGRHVHSPSRDEEETRAASEMNFIW